MRYVCTCTVLLLAFQAPAQEQAKPKVLDWNLIPLGEDADLGAKLKRLKTDYHGKEIIVTGMLRTGRLIQSEQSLTFFVAQPTRRGELLLYKEVMVTVYGLHHSRLQEGRLATVKGLAAPGSGPPNAFLHLKKATFVASLKTVKKKSLPQPPRLIADPEAAAAGKLALCKQLIDMGKRDVARFRLEELIRDYPKTKAAEEARALLKKL